MVACVDGPHASAPAFRAGVWPVVDRKNYRKPPPTACDRLLPPAGGRCVHCPAARRARRADKSVPAAPLAATPDS